MSLEILDLSNGLKLNDEGFFTSSMQTAISYPKEAANALISIEDNSFWFNHRKNCILEIVKKFPPKDRGPIFDVGGGNGYMTEAFLKSGWKSILVEPHLAGALNARRVRGIEQIVIASLEDARFKDNSISAFSFFDVVEHIKEDQAFLKNAYNALKPGGKIYITVPAYNWLWSSADDEGGHFRRYTLSRLSHVLKNLNFEIDFATYFFGFLPPITFLMRVLPYRLLKKKIKFNQEQNESDHELKEGMAKKIIDKLNAKELDRIKNGKKIHFGGSCLVCCSKPE